MLGDDVRLRVQMSAMAGAAGNRFFCTFDLHHVIPVDALGHGIHLPRGCLLRFGIVVEFEIGSAVGPNFLWIFNVARIAMHPQ